MTMPLFGMRARAHDDVDQGLGIGTDAGGVMADPLRRPGGEPPVGARHVFCNGGKAPVGRSAQMAGDAFAAMEDLDRSIGHPGPELLSQQGVRQRVVMLVDLDVVIETGAAFLPLSVGIGLDREIQERGAVQFLEQLPPDRVRGRLGSLRDGG